MPDLPFVYVMHNKILLKSTKCRFIRREGTVNEVHYDFHLVIYFTDDSVACIWEINNESRFISHFMHHSLNEWILLNAIFHNLCETFFKKKRKEWRYVCDTFYLIIENKNASIAHVLVHVLAYSIISVCLLDVINIFYSTTVFHKQQHLHMN